MMDLICLTKSMTFTKTYTLDICALYGLFCTAEKSNLKKIVCRLENNSMLLQIRKVLSKPTSNVTLSEFDNMVFSKCVNHHIKPVIVMCLKDLSLLKDSHAFRTECVWVDTWNLFCSWENNKRSQTILKDAILKSSKIYNCSSKESSFINGALAIFEERVS